ncbi:unnamed protein product (macronuclear) [Paramecium tetraurelia]|uniref:TNFR-Cys domain-containing protein n=1 Tax=Paramecium tetraurelia TaxID=5888 RepID=A0DA30_PARTE|nr:uncharacterized protein GSPATT00039347001 [Paramecium tetraurelia]CAK79897.1 unnamed protein product [Paramecium tetraurelia]|eukprot:XP_001447294.1 hypothetical protein (macronuclear) [Paramecium tetraurelia strain d4-2]
MLLQLSTFMCTLLSRQMFAMFTRLFIERIKKLFHMNYLQNQYDYQNLASVITQTQLFFQQNSFLSTISLQSFGLQSIQNMEQIKQIYFTYFQNSLQIDQQIDYFDEKGHCMIHYLKQKENTIIYANCFESEIECQQMCVSCTILQCQLILKDKLEQACIQICGDGILAKNEECDTQVQNNLGTCANCKQNCPTNCQFCKLGICINCQIGYQLDLINNSCNSICGDQLITLSETCDDGNNIIYDGCHNCQFQCQEICSNCHYGNAFHVYKSTFMINKQENAVIRNNVMKKKDYIMMNMKIYALQSAEITLKLVMNSVMMEMNRLMMDVINANRIQGQCIQCVEGYNIQNQICVRTCGDGRVLESEMCDNGNDNSRDGCTQCIIDIGFQCIVVEQKSFCFLCHVNCANCINIKGDIKCSSYQKGYFLHDNECHQCSEQCEDCERSPNKCTQCKIDKCQRCHNQLGLYADYNIRKCVTQCGDHIKAGYEQCDDGNKLDQDACNSFCQIEKGSECTSNFCKKIPEKQVEVTFSNSSTTNNLELKSEIDLLTLCTLIQIKIVSFKCMSLIILQLHFQQIKHPLMHAKLTFSSIKLLQKST